MRDSISGEPIAGAEVAVLGLPDPDFGEQVVALLRDPEIDVQNKAIDVVIRANDPETIKYLIPVLKDENEYARRAAVEVLNEIGNAKSVKDLLEAVADDDEAAVEGHGRRAGGGRRFPSFAAAATRRKAQARGSAATACASV